jgi:hypothetical protein
MRGRTTHVDEEEVRRATVGSNASLNSGAERARTAQGIGDVKLCLERGGRAYTANVHDLVHYALVTFRIKMQNPLGRDSG